MVWRRAIAAWSPSRTRALLDDNRPRHRGAVDATVIVVRPAA